MTRRSERPGLAGRDQAPALALVRSPSPESLVPGSKARLYRMAAETIRRLCQPPEAISVTDFAARARILPETSASPGPYNPAVIPYARRFQDLTADASVPMLVLCWGAQMTKSTLIENALLYRVVKMPAPSVVVLPKILAAEGWSKERWRPMVRATPILRDRVRLDRASEATLRYFPFPGGFLFVASAASETELSMRSAPFLFLDEVDRMEPIAGSGSPVEIALRRQGAGDVGLAILTSTPGSEDDTVIWPYLEGGTYELYCLPCPHCGFVQPLVWENLRFDADSPATAHYVCAGREAARKILERIERANDARLVVRASVDADGPVIERLAPRDDGATWRTAAFDVARFAEGGCGAVIDEREKRAMLAAGAWRATNPDASYPSSHLNSLYSPFAKSSWPVIVSEWQRAQGKRADLQVWVNTRLAELWQETAEAVNPNTLFARLEEDLLEGVVPRGVGLLTAGVDVQQNRFEVYVWGWGAGLESWSIASAILPGDPQQEPDSPGGVWRDLDAFLRQRFVHVDSGGLALFPIARTFIDSGFATTQVYRYTNRRRGQQIFATKGVGGDGVPLAGKPTLQGRERVVTYAVGVDKAKDEFLRSQILIARPETPDPAPGYVHLGGWLTEDQCKQLVSERRKRRLSGGRVRWSWAKKREDESNEALDCRVYARAALESFGSATILQLGAYAAQATEQAKAAAVNGAPIAAPAQAGWTVLSKGITGY